MSPPRLRFVQSGWANRSTKPDGLKSRVQTDGWTNTTDRITFSVNTVGKIPSCLSVG